jgi:L-seryl-tRNA(Ser) seleniumtransferase
VPFLYDLGSGLLARAHGLPADEPTAVDALGDGADVVVFSGDKLLGGPQAGIALGAAALIDRMRRHPIARAVRVDKMQVAALERVLLHHARGERDAIPVWRMLRERPDATKRRAARIAATLADRREVTASVRRSEAAIGGGSMPAQSLPSWAVEIAAEEPAELAARLRTGSPSVFCRVDETGIALDARTIGDDEVEDVTRAVAHALEGLWNVDG